jgi:hypothetical protein
MFRPGTRRVSVYMPVADEGVIMSEPQQSKTSPAGERAPEDVREAVDQDDPAEQPQPGAEKAPFSPPSSRTSGGPTPPR